MIRLSLFSVVFWVVCQPLDAAEVIALQHFGTIPDPSGAPVWPYTPNPLPTTSVFPFTSPFTSSEDVFEPVGSLGYTNARPNSPLRMTNRFFGWRDTVNLENPNPDGDGMLTFDSIDVSGFDDLQISFDYAAVGLDNGEDVFYTIVVDGTEQPEVTLLEGGGNLSTEGTFMSALGLIPNSATSVGFELRVVQDDPSDWGGWDNVQVTGTTAVPEPSSFLFLGMLGLGATGVSRYRKQRQIEEQAESTTA